MTRFCLANITWNRKGWRGVDVNPKAGHRAVRDAIANESFNFKFSGHGLNTKTHVYGHVQTNGFPREFERPGFILFVSKNLDDEQKRYMVVGMYGNAEFLKDKTTYRLDRKHEITSTIKAEKTSSLLFPEYLDAGRYFKKKPIVPQAGFTYRITRDTVARIVADEIKKLAHTHDNGADLTKLYRIFEQVSGEAYREWFDPEREKLDRAVSQESKAAITAAIEDLEASKSKLVKYRGMHLSRNVVLIAHIKALRGSRCQICSKVIRKRDGSSYAEAAHITPKSRGGSENRDNIMILCPNHHKEFDMGDTVVTKCTGRHVEFTMNGKRYRVRLDGGNTDVDSRLTDP